MLLRLPDPFKLPYRALCVYQSKDWSYYRTDGYHSNGAPFVQHHIGENGEVCELLAADEFTVNEIVFWHEYGFCPPEDFGIKRTGLRMRRSDLQRVMRAVEEHNLAGMPLSTIAVVVKLREE